MQYISVPQVAAKLMHIKVRVIVFYRMNGHPQTLAEHNFAAPQATGTYCTFLETSKPD